MLYEPRWTAGRRPETSVGAPVHPGSTSLENPKSPDKPFFGLRELPSGAYSRCKADSSAPEGGAVVYLDEGERLRRRVTRRSRTAADIAGRYCRECHFSCWAVSWRGDATCYGCRLLARGIIPRCARCKRQEWRLEDGRRVCRYCEAARLAGRDTRGQGTQEIARPGATSKDVPEPGGRP